jgi:hypothetical protein
MARIATLMMVEMDKLEPYNKQSLAMHVYHSECPS